MEIRSVGDPRLSGEGFEDGARKPRRSACGGEDVSPPLAWSGLPEGTRSLALICDDPDAPSGTFTYWVAWGLDPGAGGVAEGVAGPAEGLSRLGTPGYRGPCPPPGDGPHRSCFRLFA